MERRHKKHYYKWQGSCNYTFNTKGWNDSRPDNYVTLATLSIPSNF